jgi:hypothetical protein
MDGNGHSEFNDIRALLADIAARQAGHQQILDQHGAAITAIDARLDRVGTLLDRFASESGERMGRSNVTWKYWPTSATT